MKEFELDKILRIGKIGSELELEQATLADRKMRLLEAESLTIKRKRSKLKKLILDYENKHWSSKSRITKRKIDESDKAEKMAELQEEFFQNRKLIIKSKLKKHGLNQQDFGKILGHKNKSYISELMNGVNPFSLKDIIVISKLLKIELDDLVYKSIPIKEQEKIVKTIESLDKPKLKLNKNEFTLV